MSDTRALDNLVKIFQTEFAKKYEINLREKEVNFFCNQLIVHPYTPYKLFGQHYLPKSPSKIMEKMPVISEKDLIKLNTFVQSSPFFTSTLKFLLENQIRMNIAFNKGAKVVIEEIEREWHSPKRRPIVDFGETSRLLKFLRSQKPGYFYDMEEVRNALFRFQKESRFRRMPRGDVFLDYDFIAAVTTYLFDLVPAGKKAKTIDLCAIIKKIIDKAIAVETKVKITLPLKTYNSQLKAFSQEKAQMILIESSLPLFSPVQEE